MCNIANIDKGVTFLMIMIFCSFSPGKKVLRIACVGNSITYGYLLKDKEDSYPSLLQQKLGIAYEIRNFGVPGTMLQFSKKNAYIHTKEFKELKFYKPDMIILKLGTNDSRSEEFTSKQIFYKDYFCFLDSLEMFCPVILICTPIPPYGKKWKERNKILSKQIIPVIKEISKQKNLQMIDLYSNFQSDSTFYTNDGIHPTVKGYKVIANFIYNEIFKNVYTHKINK